MKFKWFITGWLAHSVFSAAFEWVRIEHARREFEREVKAAGKRIGDELRGYREGMSRG